MLEIRKRGEARARTSQEEIMEAFEAHYDDVLNQAAREEEEQGEEAQLRAEQRQQKRRQVVEKVKAHMARLDSGASRKRWRAWT